MNTENKLIAEFMSVKHKTVFGKGKVYNGYDKSWDWQMPVVEKIENFGFEFTNTDTSIETTYKAVVQFIKQYNNQINK